MPPQPPEIGVPPLAPDERRELCRIIRAALAEHARGAGLPPGRPHRASLLRPRRVEVCLRHDGQRWIGACDPAQPLYLAVQLAALAAVSAGAPARGAQLEVTVRALDATDVGAADRARGQPADEDETFSDG